MPFIRRTQKRAATTPARIAVRTTRAVEPCWRTEPFVTSCKGSESR